MVLLKNVSTDKVLGIQEKDKTIIFQDLVGNNKKQIWIKGKKDNKGYFTLRSLSSNMILTATSGYGLKIYIDGK